ncbi:MAG: DUF3662 domain-containing protein [Acidimicrobiia bacterium]|nr:DUF3662 domain-containing protein [Acidimicrobiia bacterium]
MGLARSLERRLERLADGISAAVFRGKMHPVDLANRLIRQADLLETDEVAGPTIPNRFVVAVNEADLTPGIDREQLAIELSSVLSETAAGRGWKIGGPIAVELTIDPSIGRGSIKCAATQAPASLPAWAELAEHRGDRSFGVGDNRTLIGRSDQADVQLSEAEVSRHHAILFREGGSVWIADLDSANGTTINGRSVASEPVEIGTGDMLAFGPVTFAVRVL